MHTYTISLRIESPDLDVVQVSKEFGIQPTQIRRRGDRRSESTVWEKALWEFEVFPDGRFEWVALEVGLVELLRVLTPHSQLLRRYKESYDVYLWCGIFGSVFSGGPRLSAEVLNKLSALEVPLELDIYPAAAESGQQQ